MRWPSTTGLTERAVQTCLTAPAAAVIWKKRLRTPSTTASGFARSGATLRSGRFASALESLCCSMLGTFLDNVDPSRFRVRTCGVSRDPSRS